MSEIDREVAAAMEGMAASDLAELRGDVPAAGEDADVAPGTELIGTVASVSDDDILLEFGAKTQGVLPRTQFGKKEQVEVGRRVDVVVERIDPTSGLLILSRKGAAQRATWANLQVGMLCEGRVTGVIKGGLEVDLRGIRAFMPNSQVDVVQMKDISLLLNQHVKCEVLEVDRRHKNVLISRRKVQEREAKEARERIKDEIEPGQVHKGVVKTITDFGAFVDIGGIDGLLHVRDLSWGMVQKVSDIVSPGQQVEVTILKFDKEKGRLSLGLKQCQPNPWVTVPHRYPTGTSLKARIVRIQNFGAFAELEPGVEGLIPVSEMSWERIRTPNDQVKVGDMVDCVVIRVELEKQRLALSMKQAQADPWEGVLDSFTAQSLVKGKVTRLADFGAFVELAPGIEGLIHISEMADRRVKSAGEVVQVGQEVETRVLGVDRENRRISLSIKQVAAPTGAHAEGAVHAGHAGHEGAKPEKKKRKKPLRGGLSSHFEW
ncbi:MAG: S1 RNA-binding domain-containing protein [Planctomycetota bacterium]